MGRSVAGSRCANDVIKINMATDTTQYGAQVANTILSGLQVGQRFAQMRNEAALSMRAQELQSRRLRLEEAQFRQELNPNSLENQYRAAQLAVAQKNLSKVDFELKTAQQNAELERTRNGIRPLYSNVTADIAKIAGQYDGRGPRPNPMDAVVAFTKDNWVSMGDELFDKMITPALEAAEKRMDSVDAAIKKSQFTGQAGQAQFIEEANRRYSEAWARGDQAEAMSWKRIYDDAKRGYDASLVGRGMTVETSPDGTTRIFQGPMTSGQITGSRTSRQTAAEAVTTAQDLYSIVEDVFPELSGGTIGVVGALRRMVNQSPIPMVAPGTYSEEAQKMETRLKVLSTRLVNLLKTPGNIAEQERQALMALAPSLGVFESPQSALTKLETVVNLIGVGTRKKLDEAGVTTQEIFMSYPQFVTQDEIVRETERRWKAGEFASEAEATQWADQTAMGSYIKNSVNEFKFRQAE